MHGDGLGDINGGINMIYFIQAGKSGPIKIGHTDNSVRERMAQLQTGCPYELNLLWQFIGDLNKEAEIHREFEHENIRGEWFRPSLELLDYIEYDAVNEWVVELGNSIIDVTERKDVVHVGSDGGWWVEEKKKVAELDIDVGARITARLDLGGVKEKFNINIHRLGIGIKAVDPDSLFRPVYIILGGEKVVNVEKG